MNISLINNKQYYVNIHLSNLTKKLKNNNIFYYITNKPEEINLNNICLTAKPILLMINWK